MEYKDILQSIISLLSVVIALIAYIRASELSERMNLLTERSLRSGNLGKYSSELNLLRSKLDPKLRTLQDNSNFAKYEIINMVGLYGSTPSSGRPLRHITNEIVSLWFNCFSYELPWQNHSFLRERMKELLYLQPNIDERLSNVNINFEEEYLKSAAIQLEERLIRTKYFNGLMVDYFHNLKDSQKLYEFAIMKSTPVFKELSSLLYFILSSANKLELLLEENKIEEVSLAEFPTLNREIKIYIAKLRHLENLNILESYLNINHEPFRPNQVLTILFYLELVASYSSWGSYSRINLVEKKN